MKPIVLTVLCVIVNCILSFAQNSSDFTMRTVRCNMQMPWEITYGPDNYLWATEARGYRVSRINPTDGGQNILLDLSNNKNFTNFPSVSPQGGLMGLALHPQLLTGKPYIYLAYVYQFDGCQTPPKGCFFKTKVVRYTYNASAQTLTNEEVLCDTIPGSNDHNGGRMTIATIEGKTSLFYGVGDMGAGQFDNAARVHKAQNPQSYEGKILRFNLEPDADTGNYAKWIPNDNPFGAENAVWSIGHRNPQGLVAGNGKLYEAEHGPYSDDELNIVERGSNYGFPLVVGLNDGNYNGAAIGEGITAPLILNEQQNATNIGATYRNPLKAFFPESNANIRTIYQNAVNNTPPVNNYFLSWNSIAPSGIDYYGSSAIPNWKNSVLVTSLKRRRVYRMQLNDAGTAVVGDTIPLFQDMGRFRDIAISPDGTRIFVSCDSEGQTSGPTAGTTITPINRGCILEFKYNTPPPPPPTINKDALAVTITATPTTYKIWSYIKVNVEVTASSNVENANVELKYPDATNEDFVIATEPGKFPTVSQGIFSTPFWTIGNMPSGGKATMSYYLFMKKDNKKLTLAAQVGALGQNLQNASIQIGELSNPINPPSPPSNNNQNYNLTFSANPTNYKQWEYVTLTTALTNNTGSDQANLTVSTPLPGVTGDWVYAAEPSRIAAPTGTLFEPYNGSWKIPILKKDETLTLTSTLYARVPKGKSFTVIADLVGKNVSKFVTLGEEINAMAQNDLAIKLTSNVDKTNRSITYFVEATNVGKGIVSSINYKLNLPNTATIGISQKVASEMTKFKEYCTGATVCNEWNITALAPNQKATLSLTYYVKDLSATLDAAILYKNSLPLDQNTANNTASVKANSLSTRSSAEAIAARTTRLYPTVTAQDVHIDLFSTENYAAKAQIFTINGNLAHQTTFNIDKGDNDLTLNVTDLPAGMYVLWLPMSTGVGKAMKFIKSDAY
jgi:PQQ-dependent dehydrogenase (s-GDH family)